MESALSRVPFVGLAVGPRADLRRASGARAK